jgi:uncharacterized protein YjbI with pentapeptide repeats
MATKQQLKKRWKTEEGQHRSRLVMGALQRGATQDELRSLIGDIPFFDEVAPALDLRGIEFERGLSLLNLDLAGARLDGAHLLGNISGCRMTGAVLDGVKALNVAFEHDFTGVSMVGASLKGVWFFRTDLTGADLSRAQLQSAHFRETHCIEAKLVGAKMRFAHCAGADFSGADLSGADLTGAALGSVRFDERTRLAGADLTGASMDEDLRAFAKQAGAILGAATGAYALAEFDAAFKVLRRRNAGGRFDAVLARMSELRQELVRDGSFDWGTKLAGEFPPDVMSEVADAVGEGGSNLSYYS